MRYLIYIVLIYLVLNYIFPYIMVSWKKNKFQSQIAQLANKNEYKVLEKIKLPEYDLRERKNEIEAYSKKNKSIKVDYLIISIYGIFVVKLLNLKRGFSGIKGKENSEKWEHTNFMRYRIAGVGNIFQSSKKISNPILMTKKFIESMKKNLNIELKNEYFHPFVVILPKIKTVELYEREENSTVIFHNEFNKKISEFNNEVLSNKEVKEIVKELSQGFLRVTKHLSF